MALRSCPGEIREEPGRNRTEHPQRLQLITKKTVISVLIIRRCKNLGSLENFSPDARLNYLGPVAKAQNFPVFLHPEFSGCNWPVGSHANGLNLRTGAMAAAPSPLRCCCTGGGGGGSQGAG